MPTVMRTLLALALLGLTACDGPALSLELDSSGSCAAIALETVDEALLPGWTIAAMVAERDEGAGAWILALDPKGRTMLQPWPTGAGIDLSTLGEPYEFDLQPGLIEDESWLVLDRPERMRVWRLGPAARGEIQEVPGLAEFPGPGDWTRRLLLVGDTPHVLAVPVATLEAVPRFHIAAIDPQTLALGPVWPIDFVQDCRADTFLGCIDFDFTGDSVEMLAVTAAGSMRGGAVLLALGAPNPEFGSGHDAFLTTLTLYMDQAGGPPIAGRKDGSLIPGTSGRGHLQAQFATDSRSLFFVARLVSWDASLRELLLNVVDLDPAAGSDRPQYTDTIAVGMLLQLGARAVVGGFAQGRWGLAPLVGGEVDTTVKGSVELDSNARVTSVGREQLLLRPSIGPARRVRARCVPAG